jgi:hypothetical protein
MDTLQGMDAFMMIRLPIYTVLMLLSIFLVKFLAEKFQMPEVQAWQAVDKKDE